MGGEQSCLGKYVCCGRELDSVNLEDFLEHADTGDILLFNQNTLASSWKCLSRSEWNHCAIVINTPAQKKFLVEAIEPKVVAWRLDKAMESWLKEGVGAKRICWRQLSGIRRTKPLLRSLHKFTRELQSRPFENHWMELIGAIIQQDAQRCCRAAPKPKHLLNSKNSGYDPNNAVHEEAEIEAAAANMSSPSPSSPSQADRIANDEIDMMDGVTGELEETTQALFCSELVAFYYQQAGWMGKEQLPWKFLPKDFADYRSANVPYYLFPGISLGEMIIVTPTGTESSEGGVELITHGRTEQSAPAAPVMGGSHSNPLAHNPQQKQDPGAPPRGGPLSGSTVELKQDSASKPSAIIAGF